MRYLLFAGIASLAISVAACGGAAPAAPTQAPAAPAAAKAPEPTKPAAAAQAPAQPATGAKIDPLTIRVAHTGSETHPATIAVKVWRPLLEKASGGAITIQEFPNSQLGSEREIEEGTRLGTIDMTIVAADGALPGFVPVMQVMGLPFIFRDRDHVYKTLSGPVGKELETKLVEGGFVPLAWYELGFRNITTKSKPVMVPDDLKGVKMRVQEAKVWLEFMKALGAVPTPIPFGELYSALQQGVVDGQENPIATITSMKFYEVQKQVALTGHVFTAEPILANKKWWDGLKAEQKKAIADSLKESEPIQRKTIADSENEGIAFLKGQGVNITTPDKAKFAEATKDVPKVVADMVPPELVQKIRDVK